MKNKKGFTLIELLAIIVILAIIAVITVPIILNIIENSKKGAASDSAYGFKDALNKAYITKLSGNSDYNITDGTYRVADLKAQIGLSISGKEPGINSWVLITKNNVTTGCLQYDEFKVEFTDGKVSNTEKGECVGIEPSFADDSWAVIKANLTADRNIYSIGDTKEVEIDGISYTVRLANKSSCPNGWTGSETACGVVIEFIDTIVDTDNNNNNGSGMNSSNTNAGGWPASSMYNYLNETIFNRLPEELKAAGMIINTKAISGHGNQSGATNYISTNDKLYLLSYVEIWGTNYEKDSVKLQENTVTDGTRQLEYYGTNSRTTIKRTQTGSSLAWWLRSACGTSSFLAVIGANEVYDYDGSLPIGVAPAFRILD